MFRKRERDKWRTMFVRVQCISMCLFDEVHVCQFDGGCYELSLPSTSSSICLKNSKAYILNILFNSILLWYDPLLPMHLHGWIKSCI